MDKHLLDFVWRQCFTARRFHFICLIPLFVDGPSRVRQIKLKPDLQTVTAFKIGKHNDFYSCKVERMVLENIVVNNQNRSRWSSQLILSLKIEQEWFVYSWWMWWSNLKWRWFHTYSSKQHSKPFPRNLALSQLVSSGYVSCHVLVIGHEQSARNSRSIINRPWLALKCWWNV